MFKNFLQVLTLLTFLISTGSVMGSAPGVDTWKDNAGSPAPASVRLAADNLWTAVKTEGNAAFNAGWGIKTEGPLGGCCSGDCCQRWLGCIMTCGVTECQAACESEQYGSFCWNYYTDGTTYEQKQREVTQALQKFKETVNASVSRPEGYSGDVNICQLGPWIADGRWSRGRYSTSFGDPRAGGGQWKIISASRDLSNVPKSVMAFVNVRGGWNSEADSKRKMEGVTSKERKESSSVLSDPKLPIISSKASKGRGQTTEMASRGLYYSLEENNG